MKLNSFFSLAKEFFAVSLIAYLVLFILESVFPGFVSYSLNLNYVLLAVFILGMLACFAPAEEEKPIPKPKTSDYALIAGLAALGGLLVYFKMEDGFLIRLGIAAFVFGLISVLGVMILTTEEKEPVESSFPPEEPKFPTISLKPILLKPIKLPAFLVFIFLIFTAILTPGNLKQIQKGLREPKTETAFEPTPTPILEYWDDLLWFQEKAEPSSKITIQVLNGGAGKGAAADLANLLKEEGFIRVKVDNADNYDYQNAIIKFRPEDKGQAFLIKSLLSSRYPLIEEMPLATDSAKIIVILGDKIPAE